MLTTSPQGFCVCAFESIAAVADLRFIVRVSITSILGVVSVSYLFMIFQHIGRSYSQRQNFTCEIRIVLLYACKH